MVETLKKASVLANGTLEGALCTVSLVHEESQGGHDGTAVGASLMPWGEGCRDPIRVVQALVWGGRGGVGGWCVGVGGA